MKTISEKTTVYLNPLVKKFIQHKAITDKTSVSAIVNDYFADMLEDLHDLKEVEKRRDEKTVSFQEVLDELGLNYDDLQN